MQRYPNRNATLRFCCTKTPSSFCSAPLKTSDLKSGKCRSGGIFRASRTGCATRCKPTLIGIGEARDAETIRALVEAALTGHGAYGTMHTESVAQTINRAIQVFPLDAHCAIASKLLDALRLIVVQI